MICDDCGKKPPKFHLSEIVNGTSKEINLCEDCANKNEEFKFNSSFTIQNLLAGLFEIPSDADIKIEQQNGLCCDNCETTYSEFKQTGKFGCSKCYSSFSEKIEPLLKKIHGHDTHIGKIPKRTGGKVLVKKEIETLKNRLNKAVKDEEFEQAAKLRDEIKKLNEEMDNS